MNDSITYTRMETIGDRAYMIVKCGKHYAYVIQDNVQSQVRSHAKGGGWWCANGTGEKAIAYVASWCSYATARRRYMIDVDDARMMHDLDSYSPEAETAETWEPLAL